MAQPRVLLASACSALVIAAGSVPACAQTLDQAQAPDQAQAQVDEDVIVVTAQRRAENIQDVPISITALDATRLEQSGIQDTRDLPLLTPGLRVDSVGTYVQPAIRGITTTLTSGPEANVATYLDGVYQPNTFGAVYDLPDVQQIEVLKGPQGTLFGRNATGGAILITTRQPDLADVTGKFEAGYASYDAAMVNGFVSVPLVADRLSVSVAGYFENIGKGWKRNLVTGEKDGAEIQTGLLRGKVRFLPWEGADFTLTGLYSWRRDDSTYKPVAWHGNHDLAGAPGVIIPVRPWTYATDLDTSHNAKQVNVSLRGDIVIGPGTLTTTTAYAHSYADLLFDPDNVANGSSFASTDTDYKSVTQELVYATDKIDRFQLTAGLFYFNTSSGTAPYYVQANGFQLWFKDKGESWAAFGEASYDLTDRLKVTAGVRYSNEKRSAKAATKFGGPPLISPTLIKLGSKTWDAFTPRFSLVYELTPNANVYLTYSKGFKSGIFNTPGFQTAPVDPEKVTAYEAGLKVDMGRSLRFSAAGFHYDYKDLQVPSVELNGSVLTQRILNAAAAKIWGAEANATAEIIRDFSVTAGLSYLDATYKSFPNASVNAPVAQLPPPGNARCTELVKPTSGLCNLVIDASGNAMIRAPKWSGSITATYSHEFDAGTLDASVTAYLSSKVFYEFANRIRQPGYGKINATLGWRFANDLKLTVWGRNLTNKAVLTSVLSTSSYDSVDYERPREYGVTASYSF